MFLRIICRWLFCLVLICAAYWCVGSFVCCSCCVFRFCWKFFDRSEIEIVKIDWDESFYFTAFYFMCLLLCILLQYHDTNILNISFQNTFHQSHCDIVVGYITIRDLNDNMFLVLFILIWNWWFSIDLGFFSRVYHVF